MRWHDMHGPSWAWTHLEAGGRSQWLYQDCRGFGAGRRCYKHAGGQAWLRGGSAGAAGLQSRSLMLPALLDVRLEAGMPEP